jgi:hypothetical protein
VPGIALGSVSNRNDDDEPVVRRNDPVQHAVAADGHLPEPGKAAVEGLADIAGIRLQAKQLLVDLLLYVMR